MTLFQYFKVVTCTFLWHGLSSSVRDPSEVQRVEPTSHDHLVLISILLHPARGSSRYYCLLPTPASSIHQDELFLLYSFLSQHRHRQSPIIEHQEKSQSTMTATLIDAQQQPTAAASKSKKKTSFGFIKRCCKDFSDGMKSSEECLDVGMGGPPKKSRGSSKNRRTKPVKRSGYADCGL